MDPNPSSLVVAASIVGLAAGLWLLVRGLSAYRRATAIADVGTSAIGSLAVGEVRVSGTVEPAELSLVSPLQSRSCVYYRSRVLAQEGRAQRTVLDEERAVGFRVRDGSGEVRVFPRGGSWDVPERFGGHDGALGEAPPGLALRSGPAIAGGTADRDELVARLLTVRTDADDRPSGLAGPTALGIAGGGRCAYHESWISPGEPVTIVGTVLPFDQLADPEGADLDAPGTAVDPADATEDPLVAADLAEARAAGILETDPAEAWGNAAIPGFGIGRPVRPPELDPAARPLRLADPAVAERARRTFEIAPDALILAAGPDRPLLISLGEPGTAVERHRERFLAGLAGAILAIASAVVLALQLGGTS